MSNDHLNRIQYAKLNSRQKENYNYQKIAGILADYGFITHRLSDDWKGADFIAQHIDGKLFLKVQLKGRLFFAQKYCGQGIWMAFPVSEGWYFFPHDEILDFALQYTNIKQTDSWITDGAYSFPKIPSSLTEVLARYWINKDTKV
jgi:hypothetical protein